MTGFKPMLADNQLEKNFQGDQMLAEIERRGHFSGGLMASYKVDGIRAVVREGKVVSRKLIPIPSRFVQETFSQFEGLDGELICGEPNSPTVYKDTFSAVMTHGCMTPMNFHVFDSWALGGLYDRRWRAVEEAIRSGSVFPSSVVAHTQYHMSGVDTTTILEEKALKAGYEGLILRRLDAPYKYGRSTLREGYMLKLKRFVDAEAEIIGWEERMHNANEDVRDNLGHAKRSSHKANLRGLDTLGAWLVRGVNGKYKGVEFKVGVFIGYSATDLQELWNNREGHKGDWITYKYQECGSHDRPRHPRMKGFRAKEDI